ncbi:hypothetical protein CGMCC3_g5383 [Colletotrichum fructicola]|uniref:Uncharacterized protein n=1 Tax=Colletotrichum fructicola (strain Nara gc5) TaxID=1213859 RepID=L2G6H9_COLFN|nr:uncharacterized protein CGMCC3_g5383 [Colletotrichum fructicola]KAE9578335.1 hypothetical protein CGMCC3_g5383 [Colletotrichum fructicola]KAF4426339.1 hypothetical protein CFRS1_v009733 [Colletotrichum fructicola]KAF4480451.1 hypothetical protein CGGC5_v011587 [Colletotrichum fructicola Nara gc5]KAF4888500.1 hypothetical protein CGCFRS4_v009842 [Colletotrichum fructicola]
MAKGEERRLTVVSISWTDASGQRLRLEPSKDVKTTLLLREDPKTWGWIQVTFPSTDSAHARRKSKGIKPRLLPTPGRNTFIDLLPPNIEVFATTFKPRDEPDSVLVVDVTLEDPDVVWIRARDAGSVALNDAQMEAVHLLKLFPETSRLRISVPSDKKVKKQDWDWDKYFADDTARTAYNYGFVVDKRRRGGLRKPRREADWRNFHMRGQSPRQPVQSRLPFNVKKSGKDIEMAGLPASAAPKKKNLEEETFRPRVPDVMEDEGENQINNQDNDV